MKKFKNFFWIVLLVILGSTILLSACSPNGGNNTASNPDPSNAQIVHVSVIGGTYVFSPSVFKKGVPVKLVFDTDTVVGCARSVVIPSFNVQGYIDENNNNMTFTPTKSGTFNMACTMNMYKGTFKVE